MRYENYTGREIKIFQLEDDEFHLDNWVAWLRPNCVPKTYTFPHTKPTVWVYNYYEADSDQTPFRLFRQTKSELKNMPRTANRRIHILNEDAYEAALKIGRFDVAKPGIPIMEDNREFQVLGYLGLVRPI